MSHACLLTKTIINLHKQSITKNNRKYHKQGNTKMSAANILEHRLAKLLGISIDDDHDYVSIEVHITSMY